MASISHLGQVSGPQQCPWVCGLSGPLVGSFRAVDCQTDDWFEALCRRGLALSSGRRPLNVGADTGLPGALAWWLGFHSTSGLFSECRHKRHCLLWHCCEPSCWFSQLGCFTAIPLLPQAPSVRWGVISALCSPPTLLVLSGSLVWGAQGAPACRVT